MYPRWASTLTLLHTLTLTLGNLVVYPSPTGVPASDKYRVHISQGGDSHESFVHISRSNTRAAQFSYVHPGRTVSWTSFTFTGLPVVVEVTTPIDFHTCAIRPSSYGYNCQRKGPKTAVFRVASTARTMSVELDSGLVSDEVQHKLMVFADPPEQHVPHPNAPGVLYFGPGAHHLNGSVELGGRHLKEVYLAPGAVVYGAFRITTGEKIKIHGRGVLSGHGFDFHDPRIGEHGMLDLGEGDVEGITVTEPSIRYSRGLTRLHLNHVRFLGSWTYNSGGVLGGPGTVVSNSFMENNDDAVMLFWGDQRVENTVLWQKQNGAAFQSGWWPQRHVKNVTVTNVDVIHGDWCAFRHKPCSLGPNDAVFNAVHLEHPYLEDYLFKDIRIEGACSRFVYMVLPANATGYVRNIRFENVHVDSQPNNDLNHNELRGTPQALLSDWTFVNLNIGGRCINSAHDGDFVLDPHSTRNIHFRCPDGIIVG